MKSIIFTVIFFISLESILQTQWMQLNTNTNTSIFTVKFFNANTGVAAGQDTVGKILRTTNGGLNWIVVFRTAFDEQFKCSSFINDQTGWMGTYSSTVYKTTNNGINWTQVSNSLSIGHINSISFINSNTGWVIGESGGVSKSTNGGYSWTIVAPNFSGKSVYFINESTGIIGTYQNTLRKTNNGGNGFPEIYQLPENTNISDIFFLNPQTGYACGNRKLIMKTTNSGSNWFQVNLDPQGPPVENLKNIYFIDENLGYAAGQWIYSDMHGTTVYGILRKTTNGGLNWSGIQLNPVPSSFEDITVTEGQIAYITGMQNHLFKSSNAGYIGVNIYTSEIPQKFILHQNYPNPFNPSTKIRFEIPNGEYSVTRIMVYDAAGKEIRTLVNENLRPGIYETSFDANGLTSGIYFYKITSGNFTSTKKLVVLK